MYEMNSVYSIDACSRNNVNHPNYNPTSKIETSSIVPQSNVRTDEYYETFRHDRYKLCVESNYFMDTPISSTTNYASINRNSISVAISSFYEQKVLGRKQALSTAIQEMAPVICDLLKEIEKSEPRFVSSLNYDETSGRFDGLTVVGGTLAAFNLTDNSEKLEKHFNTNLLSPPNYMICLEVNLFLNQMGVFNFVDDGNSPGCSVLKLSDGRKRSMSLWVEFITASGFLSARKIRARFHSLLIDACAKIEGIYGKTGGNTTDGNPNRNTKPIIKIFASTEPYVESVCSSSTNKLLYSETYKPDPFNNSSLSSIYPLCNENFSGTSFENNDEDSLNFEKTKQNIHNTTNGDVTLTLWDKYHVTIVPAFRCPGMWPLSANAWPYNRISRHHLSNGSGVSNNKNETTSTAVPIGLPFLEPKISLWPNQDLISKAKSKGFLLISREPQNYTTLNKQLQTETTKPPFGNSDNTCKANNLINTSTKTVSIPQLPPCLADEKFSLANSLMFEGDTWLMTFTEAENILLEGGCRKIIFQILKTLRDRHLNEIPGKPISVYVLKTLLLFECEKHPYDFEWDWHMASPTPIISPTENLTGQWTRDSKCNSLYQPYSEQSETALKAYTIPRNPLVLDRIIGVLNQLLHCLGTKKCPHYFLPAVDLFKEYPSLCLTLATREVWKLLRKITFSPEHCWKHL